MSNVNLISDLVDEAIPVAPISLFARYCFVVAAITVYMLSILFLFDVRDDWWQQINTSVYAIEMFISLIIAFSAAILSINLSVPAEKEPSSAWFILFLLAFMGCVIWFFGKVNLQSLFNSLNSNHFHITIGVIAAAIPVAFGLLFLLQRGSPTNLSWAGALALLSASSVGHFLMRTIGKADNFADVMLWCYSPVLLLGVFGIFIGQKFLRW